MGDDRNLETVLEFQDINSGLIPAKRLTSWINEYFGVDEDLSKFKRRDGGYIEIASKDDSRGYVFGEQRQMGKDYESKMKNIKNKFLKDKFVAKFFVDLRNQRAGFSWENY